MDSPSPDSLRPAHAFVTTQWTRVLEARGTSPEAQIALSELCQAYYAPVVAFLRRSSTDEDGAREQAHEFFAHLLERDGLAGVDRERGHFRNYLLGGLKHFLAHQRERAHREKRGGGVTPIALDLAVEGAGELTLAETQTLPPDQYFDRQWAFTVLDRALSALESEWIGAGKGEDFLRLKPWLTGDADHGDQAQAARASGISEGALKVAIHRLRRRFRELLKREVAQTLTASHDVEDELKQLFSALTGS